MFRYIYKYFQLSDILINIFEYDLFDEKNSENVSKKFLITKNIRYFEPSFYITHFPILSKDNYATINVRGTTPF